MLSKKRIRTEIPALLILALTCITGCKETKVAQEDTVQKEQYLPQVNEVDFLVLEKRPFQEELLSNGKLVALQKSLLTFEVGGALEKLNVKNGDLVQHGQTLAALQAFTYQQQLDKAEMVLKKAELEFHDMLVGRGYDMELLDSVPANIYEMAAIRSGFQEAGHLLEDARFNWNGTLLKAPFTAMSFS